jgi:hypothetical protein
MIFMAVNLLDAMFLIAALAIVATVAIVAIVYKATFKGRLDGVEVGQGKRERAQNDGAKKKTNTRKKRKTSPRSTESSRPQAPK